MRSGGGYICKHFISGKVPLLNVLQTVLCCTIGINMGENTCAYMCMCVYIKCNAINVFLYTRTARN